MNRAPIHRRSLPRARRVGQRGSLLVVCLMIILVMAGLALVGARGVMMELSQVGNFRAGEQSLRITQSGLEATVAMAIEKGDAFPEYMLTNQNKLTAVDVAANFYDMTTKGSFGKEAGTLKGVNFVSQMSLPSDTNRVPGYPVNDAYVWKKYSISTYGYYGTTDSVAATVSDIARNSARQYVSQSFVGPYFIGGGGQ